MTSGRPIFEGLEMAHELKDHWADFRKMEGCLPKIVAAYKWSQEAMERGKWNENDPVVRYWLFLVGSFVAQSWLFPFWILFKVCEWKEPCSKSPVTLKKRPIEIGCFRSVSSSEACHVRHHVAA